MREGPGSRAAPAVPLTTAVVDGPRGRWTHHAWDAPHLPPALAGVVRGFWLVAGTAPRPRERSFPGGHVELVVHLGPRYRRVVPATVAPSAAGGAPADGAPADGASARGGGVGLGVDLGVGDPFPRVCVTGVLTAPLVIGAPPGPCRVLGILLHPVGAYALLGCPLDALAGQTLDLADVAGPAAAALAECCADAPTAAACLARAAAWVAERVAHTAARGIAPHPAVAWAAGALERAGGAGSVAALLAHAGLGRTRFAAAFRAQVGVGPKRYARVLRFRRALALVRAGRPLSEAALAAGFYDQAHLNASFREFAGLPPGAVAAAAGYPASSPTSPTLAEPG